MCGDFEDKRKMEGSVGSGVHIFNIEITMGL